jgi:glycosyltransferase involved in cell wall biosynthesis
MRYIWDMYGEYFGKGRAGLSTRAAMRLMRNGLRRWDYRTAQRIDYVIANSRYIADRIFRVWGLGAEVIHPPVDCSRFEIDPSGPDDYFLVAGGLQPYKRADVAIEAFNRLGLPLKVVGSGGEEPRLRRMAGPNIEFLGAVSDEDLARLYARCRAGVFAASEDFGIMQVECQAAGRPVISFGHGGALETVVGYGHGDPPTGVFFYERTPEAIIWAVETFMKQRSAFDPEAIRALALAFDVPRFREAISETIARAVKFGPMPRP